MRSKVANFNFAKNYMQGNPYLRLVRDEVEALVVEKYGDNYFEKKKLKKKISASQPRAKENEGQSCPS
jgi:hypothetical protein